MKVDTVNIEGKFYVSISNEAIGASLPESFAFAVAEWLEDSLPAIRAIMSNDFVENIISTYNRDTTSTSAPSISKVEKQPPKERLFNKKKVPTLLGSMVISSWQSSRDTLTNLSAKMRQEYGCKIDGSTISGVIHGRIPLSRRYLFLLKEYFKWDLNEKETLNVLYKHNLYVCNTIERYKDYRPLKGGGISKR